MTNAAPVKRIQKPGEFDRLMDLYVKLKPRKVLEIGVYFGGTLHGWITNAPHGARIVAVDLPGGVGGSKHSADPDAWARWAEESGVDLTVILGDSHRLEVIEQVYQFAPFDFVFIDGDHSYDGVRMDWLNYSKMVEYGGVVAFHDIVPHPDLPTVQVDKLWREICHEHNTSTFIDDPEQRDMGIGLVWL